MSDRKQAIRRHLEATRAVVMEAVAGLGSDDWQKPVASSEGAWSVKQALAHVASAEGGQLATCQRILAGEIKLPAGFSRDYWNQRQVEKRKERAPAELFDELAASRQKLLAWIEGLAEADLDKSGEHASGDTLTVEQVCFRIGEHEVGHAAEIRQALGK